MALAIANEPVIIAKGIIFTSSSFVSLHYWAIKQNKTNPLTHFWYLVFVLAIKRMDVSFWKIGFFFYLLLWCETWTWPCGGFFLCAQRHGSFSFIFVIAMQNFIYFLFLCETRGIWARRWRSSNFSFVFCCYDTKQGMGI